MEKPESKKSITNINLGLPAHMLQVIFSKLPIVNLPACRLVCKNWNNLILDYASSSKFVSDSFFLCTADIIPNSYPTHYYNRMMQCIDIDTKHSEWMSSVATFRFESDWSYVSKSCNGLLFLTKFNDDTSCNGILNPMTNEFIKLPGPEEDIYGFGFGFSPKTKQYKLVRVKPTPTTSIFEIFTFGRSGTNEWSHIDSLPCVIRNYGAYLNGVIYWIGRCKENEYVVYGFDVENEKFESIAVLEVGSYSSQETIETCNGSVYATFFTYSIGCKIQVWRMQSYGGKASWTREFVIEDIPNSWVWHDQQTVYICLVKAFEDGRILCLINYNIFLLYNPKTGRKEMKKLNNIVLANLFVRPLESLHFGSLSDILSGDDETFFYFI